MGAIVVTGIPGVGKTTVMQEAAKAAKLPVIVYGTVMFEVAKAKGAVQDRDAMRRLPPAAQRDIQKEAARRIGAMGNVVVDTHCTVKTPTGYLPGLPAWVLEDLRPSTIVLVEASPEEIQARRAKDATRRRDEDSLEAIAEHQEVNRRFAAAYATLTGATVSTVLNRDGGVDEAMRQILPAMGVRLEAKA